MDEMILKRGGREITLTKVPDKLVIRSKEGTTSGDEALEAAYGVKKVDIGRQDLSSADGLNIYVAEDPTRVDKIIDELRTSKQIDFVSNIYSLDKANDNEVIPTGTITIQFKPDVPKDRRAEILEGFGLKILNDLKFLPNAFTAGLTERSSGDPLTIAEELQKLNDISIAEPDMSFKVSHYNKNR